MLKRQSKTTNCLFGVSSSLYAMKYVDSVCREFEKIQPDDTTVVLLYASVNK